MTTASVRAAGPVRVAPPAAARTGRTLPGYLLVPRPKDLVKALVVPLAFAVGAVTTSTALDGRRLLQAALVWFALELLVYQARYQWNDVRGFAADQAHPDAASRGRLPGPMERARPHIAASTAVAVLRLLLTAALAVAVPEVAGLLLAATLGVFGVAAGYERLRGAATGHTSEVPVPLRPALVGLWVAVGAGYAVRGLTGLALAVDLTARPGLAVVAGVAMWALGVVFVTCRWTLEAMCFGRVEDGRMAWEVRPDQAREHTLGLVRWLPADASAAASPCSWRALQGATPLTAPWHLALAVAAGAASLAGLLLVGR
ncbi:MAG: putative rane protein, partial [Frankiales bacterium]|nr:putative rane protein [Frankiales bacterium]